MSWCYRVVKYKAHGKQYWGIREVYDGNSYCSASVDDWETREDLKGTLELMLKAFDKPDMDIVQ